MGSLEFLLESINLNHRVANQMMKVSSEIDSNWRTSSILGLEALYQIATMPEESRTVSHTIQSTGQTKTVDEIIVRELREVKAELKKVKEEKDELELQNMITEDEKAKLSDDVVDLTIDLKNYKDRPTEVKTTICERFIEFDNTDMHC